MSEPEPFLAMPRGTITKHASVTCYARTRVEWERIRREVEHERDFIEGPLFLAWTNPTTGIRWMVMRPTQEQEEDFDFENLRRRYRGE